MTCTYENCIVDVCIQLKKAPQSKNKGPVCLTWLKRNTYRYIDKKNSPTFRKKKVLKWYLIFFFLIKTETYITNTVNFMH